MHCQILLLITRKVTSRSFEGRLDDMRFICQSLNVVEYTNFG